MESAMESAMGMNCISCGFPFTKGELFIPSGRDADDNMMGRHEDCITTLRLEIARLERDVRLLDFLTFGRLDMIARMESLQKMPTVRDAIQVLIKETEE